jgi:glycosyltransferase involved in cell wall biosynthesis
MKILQVSTADIAGGAENVARQLFQEYRNLGHDSWLVVGAKRSDDPNILQMVHYTNVWSRLCMSTVNCLQRLDGKVKGIGRLQKFIANFSYPSSWLRQKLGYEKFDFPGTWNLLNLPLDRPEIIHCHNLHGPFLLGGGYFDLRVLPWLSQQKPVILTLHDAWLLSGHCAHSFDCERWKTGCGYCPDLTIYPATRYDRTAYNWQCKRDIFAQSHLYVTTPSHWLMRKLEQSILATALVQTRIIPYGVDLSIFHPEDKRDARVELGIPQDAKVLLFVANTIRKNIWKDYQMMRAVVAQVAESLVGQTLYFVGLGEDAPKEYIGRAEINFVPYQTDPSIVARYYQAADIYIHAARVDTFPNTVLESLACGTPVVATSVGGIPEQIKSLQMEDYESHNYSPNEATGVLVPPQDADKMSRAVEYLLNNYEVHQELSQNAARDARNRFDMKQQVQTYLDWYQEIIAERS